jgi:hypothetical protein
MSEKNSFDQLATEILFEIFDYLSYHDIIYTFLHLNQRFNSMLLHYHEFLNHFITPTRHFSFWQNLLPIISSRIECLVITTRDFNFSLNLFPNRKSLIISSSLSISYDQLNIILKSKQFKKLNSFKIQSEIVWKRRSYISPLFNEIFNNENSLHTYQSLEQHNPSQNMNYLKFGVNLRSLSFKIFQSCFTISYFI